MPSEDNDEELCKRSGSCFLRTMLAKNLPTEQGLERAQESPPDR